MREALSAYAQREDLSRRFPAAPPTRARLFVGGVAVPDRLLARAEVAAVRRVRHWYSLRGPFGRIFVARRRAQVFVQFATLGEWTQRAYLPQLIAILVAAEGARRR